MRYFLVVLMFSFMNPGIAQIKRAFLTPDGKYTNKPGKAASYVLIQKLEDSAYLVREYDMHNAILLQGTFKDELMMIPEGKFLFYRKNRFYIKNAEKNAPDTNSYVFQVGYFLNGVLNGSWINYSSRGVISSVTTFEKGKLNGLYQSFSNDYVYEGNYVDNLKEGLWQSHRVSDSLLLSEAEYKHDTLKNEYTHWIPAMERGNLNAYLTKRLKKFNDLFNGNNPVISYTINKEGRIISPEIIKGISPEVDEAIINALEDGPQYYPATYNYKPIEQKIKRVLYLTETPDTYFVPSLARFNNSFNEARKYIYLHQSIVIGANSSYSTTYKYGVDNLMGH